MFSSEEQSTRDFRPAHFAHVRHMAVFAVVVDAGSFTAASKRLGIAKSAVSRYVSELEARVGVTLLQRTTRRLRLTDAGERFFAECAQLVDAAIGALASTESSGKLVGSLRIGATFAHGQHVIVPATQSFLALHPDLDIRLELNNRFVDLVDEGIDVTFRVGSRGPTPHYVSRKIATTRYRLYGTPEFLDGCPPIQTPQDAERLPWVLGHNTHEPDRWEFRKGDEQHRIQVRARLTVSDIVARTKAAALGMGLVGLTGFMVNEDLEARFVRVLPDYDIVPEIPIYAVYPSNRFVSPRVAGFLAHLEALPRHA